MARVGDLVGGRYRLTSELGRGGMGVVYRATDTVLHREVALKVMGGISAEDATFRARFVREAATLARLDSPHIVVIHDHGEHRTETDVARGKPGPPYLVTQLVAGGDLGSYISRHGPLPPVHAVALLAQVASALRDAHRAGVIHRDVKPANVLLRDRDAVRSDDLHVYLCDFGIAQITLAESGHGSSGGTSDATRIGSDALTEAGAVAGTWKYLAPERLHGGPATAASDIYAAGCLLWSSLKGAPPFDGRNDYEVATAHEREPVPQLGWTDDFGRALDHVLRRCLAKLPGDRYQDADALRTDLLSLPRADYTSPRPVVAPLPGQPRSTPAQQQSASQSPLPGDAFPRPPRTQPEPVDRTVGARGRRRPASGRRTAVVTLAALVLLAAGAAGLAVAIQPTDTGDPGRPSDEAASRSSRPPDERARAGGAKAADPGSPGSSGGELSVTGDADGDGLGDLALSIRRGTGVGATTSFTTYRGTGSGMGSPTEVMGIDTANVPLRGDFDADGIDEYVGITSTATGGLEIDPADGDSPWLVEGAGFDVPPLVGDFDGDGADDLAFLGFRGGGGLDAEQDTGGEIRLALGGDDARVAAPRLSGPFEPNADLLVPADLDGDGDDDLALIRPQGIRGGAPATLTMTPLLSQAGTLLQGQESPPLFLTDVLARPVDADGDGRDEIALVASAGGRPVRLFSLVSGDLLTEQTSWAVVGGSTAPRTVRGAGVSDVDGDGLEDLLLVRAEPLGGPITGIDLLRAGDDSGTASLVDLAGEGLSAAKIADGVVSRPFDLGG